MTIKLLPQNIINQIAAGEVVERPSSVVKELIENAIDAGAKEITVKVIDAGKSFISVSDDGHGMDKKSLELCVLSHATSKLTSENLFDIRTFGFRGEALPSIASVSRLSIASSDNASSEGWKINLEGTVNNGLMPANHKRGTTVEVRDLFFVIPARLKFLKSDISELENCCNVFNRIAIAFPDIAFKFIEGSKEKFYYKPTDNLQKRIKDIFGDSFGENVFEFEAAISKKEEPKLHGFIGVPTFNKASANYQYFFVNNRFVKEKIFSYALKSAYSGLIPYGRYAAAILFLDVIHTEVDVNAHPAKIEVRFKNSEKIRLFIMSELKKALASFVSIKSTTENINNFNAKKLQNFQDKGPNYIEKPIISTNIDYKIRRNDVINDQEFLSEQSVPKYFSHDEEDDLNKFSLGNAIHQVGNTYIIAEDGENLIIVDQHAAAERIMLENLKNNLSLDSQNLLLPEVFPITKSQVELLERNKYILIKFGIHYEKLADDLIVINALPLILGNCDAKSLMNDIVDELSAFGDAYSIDEKINRILSTISCHRSLRAGEKLTICEMNSLLRKMENTQNIAQCCHGRPSYVILSKKNLNNFFERY